MVIMDNTLQTSMKFFGIPCLTELSLLDYPGMSRHPREHGCGVQYWEQSHTDMKGTW